MMSSKRATIAAAKSLKSISKVCSSGPLNSLNSLRNLSTAAERLDPASANGYHSENLSSDSQNANGLCYDYQNPSDFRQNLNPRSGFGKVPVGPDGNFSGCNGGNREGYGGECQNRRAGDNANSHGFWEQRSSELQQSSSAVRVTTSTGFEENQSGVSPARFRNGFQQSAPNVNGYASDYQSGVFAGGSGNGFQQSPSYLDENSNSYQNQTVGHLQQYTDVANSSNFQRTGHAPSNAYTQSMYYPSNTYAQGFRESSGHPNGFYSQDLPSNRHGSVGGNYSQNLAGPQENIGQNIWNRGHFQSEATSHSQPKAESSETSENAGHVGSIEEFDMFCGEGKVKEAMEVLALLDNKGIPIDLPRYVKLMQLCGDNKAVEEAKAIHEHITRFTSPVSVYILNRILEMYSKCGAMDEASAVFDKMVERNFTTWDTMITGLANNGLGEEAIDIFTKFKEAGLKPDGQMFVSVLSACAVVGDAHEGMLHFKSMTKDYGIIPSMEHYVSAVDMLGKIGHLDEALEFIENMPMKPGVEVWETLMNLCRIHGEGELGDRCAELIGELDPSRLNEQSRSGLVPVNTSEMAKEEEKKKAAKKNLLEARSTVHEYRAGDTSHPETGRIYAQLRGLRGLMKEAGYVAETRFVLHDIDQESKEDALLAHSERLAVSYGLLSSPARSPIRVIKNLRVCGDCHNALKIMSKLVGREFIMRDAKRFHHFKDGQGFDDQAGGGWLGPVRRQISDHDQFTLFKSKYGKSCATLDEHNYKFKVFTAKLRHARHQELDPSAVHGVTQFYDLAPSKFRRTFLRISSKLRLLKDANQALILPTDNLPEDFDWRDHGAVTSVKIQSSCGHAGDLAPLEP